MNNKDADFSQRSHRYRVTCNHYSGNFSLFFSQPRSVDSDMPKSRDTFAWLSPLSTCSAVFTLSLTVHTFCLRLDMMLCYSTNDCCSGRAIVHGTACCRCHSLYQISTAARPALYRFTALNRGPIYSDCYWPETRPTWKIGVHDLHHVTTESALYWSAL